MESTLAGHLAIETQSLTPGPGSLPRWEQRTLAMLFRDPIVHTMGQSGFRSYRKNGADPGALESSSGINIVPRLRRSFLHTQTGQTLLVSRLRDESTIQSVLDNKHSVNC
jgi:hypothetical protein